MKMKMLTWLVPVVAASGLAGAAIGYCAAKRGATPETPAAEIKTPEQADEEIRALIEKANDDIYQQDAATNANSSASAQQPQEPLVVEKISYNGDDELRLEFSQRPDMDVVRQYISVEPLNEGVVTFRYTTPRGRHPATGNHIPTLYITGDFAHGADVTLRIRKGFPMHGAASGAGALAEDYTYTFRRKDRDATVDFADAGRYLPPVGERAIAIRSVNVPKVAVAVQKVPEANLVYMLALEEDAYRHINKDWARSDSVRDEFAADLAGESSVTEYEPHGEPNKTVDFKFPVGVSQQPGNGIFVVRASIADKDRDDDFWGEKGKNQYRFRVICVSDLGLSVRRISDGDTILAWLNSFTTGKPVAGAKISVYSAANVLVARGVTGPDGLCRPDRIAPGEPFAVIATSADGTDSTFIALRDSMEVDETYPDGAHENYLKPGEAAAFVWTERGIYRHDEKIFFHALLRGADGAAPPPFPVELRLVNPSDDTYAKRTLVSDESGAVSTDEMTVPSDQPGGTWSLELWTPGKNGKLLGSRQIKIEEFAPPQIRVGVAAESMKPQDFTFTVTAEHLYGGAAKGLPCEGAIVFEDVPFAPEAWKGYHFGNDDRALKPSFRRLKKAKLDDAGAHVFAAPLWEDTGLPKAAVRATAQGTVFEDGGRPASSRKSVVCHLYPYYIGTTLTPWMKRPAIGFPQIDVACVLPDGRRAADPRRLVAKVERVDTVYAYRRDPKGWATWDCERVRTIVADNIDVSSQPDGDNVLSLPVKDDGEYVLTIDDRESDVSFAMSFYLGEYGDEAVRASLAQPTAVSLTPDKAFYRVGDEPRIMVKSPFTGTALLTVVRDSLVWRQVLELTNATTCVTLPATRTEWAPSVDVEVSVIQAVKPGTGRFAVRAHGEAVIVVRPEERELPVAVDAKVAIDHTGEATVDVEIDVPGAPAGATAVVTLVDEGINILTDERVPDPVAFFAQPRTSRHPLYDLYHRLLPVLDSDALKANGVKTGGGFGAELLSRVSPVPTRRFKPLALWQTIPLDGEKGKATFRTQGFVGEVRVTALAWTAAATGAGAVQRKVAPKIVVQPDAPRFVAPGDVFDVTLPISNRSGEEATVGYSLFVEGPAEMIDEKHGGAETIAKDGSIVRTFRVKATSVGEAALKFSASGAGENHTKTILLPIRPASPWEETAGVDVIAAGGTKTYAAIAPYARRSFAVSGSRLSELAAALEWLADYPHGCLEQTSSRIFPLVTAGGILATLGSNKAGNVREYVEAGVRRVESMVRYSNFVMWPDCNYAPWDKEVSLYAAHFLVEAEKNGVALNPVAKSQVMKFLGKWAMSSDTNISAYACHTLALAGKPEKDRMLRLYDGRKQLTTLSRARLARAFTAVDDRARAIELLSGAAAPDSVKDAAFSLLALLDLDPEDPRIPELVLYLTSRRDKSKFSWGTTDTNAHALLALGEYYRRKGGGSAAKIDVQRIDNADGSVRFVNSGAGDAFVSWRLLDIPDGPQPAKSATASGPLTITRKIFDSDDREVDLAQLERGDLLYVEITISSGESRSYSDLIIEDLFPAAFEPVLGNADNAPTKTKSLRDWVLRYDARDDRMLVYSKYFGMKEGESICFRYPVRIVTAGEFVLPPASVEAMYAPSLKASSASATIKVVK